MGQSGDMFFSLMPRGCAMLCVISSTLRTSRTHFPIPRKPQPLSILCPSYFMEQIEMSRERGRPFNPLFPYLFAFIGGWYFWCSWLHMHIEGAVQSSVAPYKGQCTLALPVSSSSHPPPYQHHHHRSPFNTSNSLYNPLPHSLPIPQAQLRFMFDCSICRDFPDVFVSRRHSPGHRTLTPVMSPSCFYWKPALIGLSAGKWQLASIMTSLLWLSGFT